ncbi:MAG TPA: chemotaxis protein CheW [Candidatus Binatus sp.]|jgi:chemotaxis signal transduction protein|nr:chemotaxis protein CheW [Candidatus Binatus sp.]
MKIAAQDAVKARKARRPETVILFNVSNQLFAIAADSVQEIRSTDSLGAALEIEQQEILKVRHTIERGHRTYYVVNACAHFGLRVVRPTLVLMLRQIRVAVLVDKIERMAEISGLHALPRAFLGAERQWYRGLAYLEDQVIPVVSPLGFLTSQEFQRLDGATAEASRRDLERAAQI